MRNSKPILLVEDDDVDVMTVERALKDSKVPNPLVSTGDGEEALGYLKSQKNKKPCVVLLDLNMPKMGGIEFLKIIKKDESLRKIPVVVLTTSSAKLDITKSFELGVAGYMIKSVDYAKFVETIKTIDRYWTSSELPPDGG